MGPNDVDIVRVFTRSVGGTTAETALPDDKDFEIVLELEAGSAAFAGGGQFGAGVVVRDLSNGTFLTATPSAATAEHPAVTPGLFANSSLNSSNWPTQNVKFVYTVSHLGPPDLTTRENHIGDVLAALRVGVTNPDESTTQSPMFVITRP